MRIATWAGDFSRKGPGLLLRDLMREKQPGLQTVQEVAPDILLLTNFDFDAGLVALSAMNDQLRQPYPYLFAKRPNTGVPTGLDIDGDNRLGGPRDAQGFGWFSGQGGQAILSRWPMQLQADYTTTLWRDLPDSAILDQDTGFWLQRLSSTAHWAVSVQAPQGRVTLLTVGATPPVFDGPEDRNGRRNRDEVLLWHHVLAGRFGQSVDGAPIVLGNLNLDTDRGDGIRHAARVLLGNDRLQDPLPGVPTVEWEKVGKMRVSYILPGVELVIKAAGVAPPEEGAGPHSLVWVDLTFPSELGQ